MYVCVCVCTRARARACVKEREREPERERETLCIYMPTYQCESNRAHQCVYTYTRLHIINGVYAYICLHTNDKVIAHIFARISIIHSYVN